MAIYVVDSTMQPLENLGQIVGSVVLYHQHLSIE